LRKVANRVITDKQTNYDDYISFFADVIGKHLAKLLAVTTGQI